MTQSSIRGPVLISISLGLCLMSILQTIQMNTTHICTLVLLSFGLYFTISDLTVLIKLHLKTVEEKIHHICSTLVLDDILRQVFSLDPNVGFVGLSMATFSSLVGIYNIPFTKKQKMQLIQSALPSFIDGEKLFFSPGGICDVIPYHLKRILKDGAVESKESTSQNLNTAYQQVDHILHDLSFDDSSVIEAREIDTDSWTEDGGIGIPLHHSILTSDKADVNNFTFQEQQHIPSESTQENFTSIGDCTKNFQHKDPIECIQSIVKEHIRATFKKVKNEQLIRVAMISSIALFIQLKQSRAARKMIRNTLHATISIGLIAAISGAIGTLKIKHQLNRMMQGFEQRNSNSLNLTSHRDTHQNVIFAIPRLQLVQKTREVVSNMIEFICREKIRSKWRFILAIYAVYSFRRRKTRMCRSS